MIRRPPRSTLFPTRRSSDLSGPSPMVGTASDLSTEASDVCTLNPQISMPARTSPDRKSTRLNSSHLVISYAVFCLKKKNHEPDGEQPYESGQQDTACSDRLL